jgi:hypothetical protein
MPDGLNPIANLLGKVNANNELVVSLEGAATNTVLSEIQTISLAELNAGVTVLPAVAGLRYRIVNFGVMCIGGANATEAFQVKGTVSSVVTVLMSQTAIAQGNLQRFTAAGTQLPATDGVAYAPLDVNTPVIVDSASGGATGPTSYQLLIDYVLEP